MERNYLEFRTEEESVKDNEVMNMLCKCSASFFSLSSFLFFIYLIDPDRHFFSSRPFDICYFLFNRLLSCYIESLLPH